MKLTCKVRKVKSIFGFCGVWEKWNCFETGMTWQLKLFFGHYVMRIAPFIDTEQTKVQTNVDK